MLAQLQQAYEASLIMLANAIELRDHYTRGHVERVMYYSLVIAEQMGWSQSQLKPLQFGAILHDIGKIYVQEGILSKAGPLDDMEWLEMKQHTVVGAELLLKIPYLNQAIPIIRFHHERWDGSGYPLGLVAEEIPLGARIVSVTDSFDAMTTTRVYQKSVTHEDALKEIKACSGKQYDPAVVEAFIAAWDKIVGYPG
jgi:putative nucleotidyltransferase with HDIG domain